MQNISGHSLNDLNQHLSVTASILFVVVEYKYLTFMIKRMHKSLVLVSDKSAKYTKLKIVKVAPLYYIFDIVYQKGIINITPLHRK